MRPGFCLWPQNKVTEFWMGWWDILSAEQTEISKVLHHGHVDNFFDSQGVVHKEFEWEGKTVNAEFYKGVMDCLLKRIQLVSPAASCSQDFFLLHDNAPAQKAAFASFWPPKCYNPLSPPHSSADLSPPDNFLFPRLKMKIKGLHFVDVAEIQVVITGELKKIQNEEIWQLFRNCMTTQKPVYMKTGLILN